jgi:hypothetical protein
VRTALAAFLALALLAAAPAQAQNVVNSAGPDRVAVTLYRDPGRNADDGLNLEWLEGFALVTETRTVTLPAGEAEIRFEGVAGGIIPQSAIVSGFPDGVVERNRDAYLLSPATLLDRSLGQRVAIRRTSHATGAVVEAEAVIRSGADGAVVLQTRDGNEALRCTGLSETLVYGGLPAGLSARPTLSVRTRSSRPVTATVTLAYLASGFDWQANYVANLSADGSHLELLAWLTLGSSDETSFANANVQAVAGRINREDVDPQPREGGPLTLQCWPAATTSDIPLEEFRRMAMGTHRVPNLGYESGEEIVVTGSRIQRGMLDAATPITVVTVAELENLGDLKLYRIPETVTLAARSQKQVAFMVRARVQVRFAYRQGFAIGNAFSNPQEAPTRFMLTRNRDTEGLGEPLPAGRLVLFAQGSDRPILLGESVLDDRAVGEEVEIPFGPSPGIRSAFRMLSRRGSTGRFELVVTNDQPQPVTFEGEFHFSRLRSDARLGRRNGRPLWTVTVPANGRAVLCFSGDVSGEYQPEPRVGSESTCRS